MRAVFDFYRGKEIQRHYLNVSFLFDHENEFEELLLEIKFYQLVVICLVQKFRGGSTNRCGDIARIMW